MSTGNRESGLDDASAHLRLSAKLSVGAFATFKRVLLVRLSGLDKVGSHRRRRLKSTALK